MIKERIQDFKSFELHLFNILPIILKRKYILFGLIGTIIIQIVFSFHYITIILSFLGLISGIAQIIILKSDKIQNKSNTLKIFTNIICPFFYICVPLFIDYTRCYMITFGITIVCSIYNMNEPALLFSICEVILLLM